MTKTYEEQIAELQKQFDEENAKEKEIDTQIQKLQQENAEFFQGPVDELNDEIERLHVEVRELKERFQP